MDSNMPFGMDEWTNHIRMIISFITGECTTGDIDKYIKEKYRSIEEYKKGIFISSILVVSEAVTINHQNQRRISNSPGNRQPVFSPNGPPPTSSIYGPITPMVLRQQSERISHLVEQALVICPEAVSQMDIPLLLLHPAIDASQPVQSGWSTQSSQSGHATLTRSRITEEGLRKYFKVKRLQSETNQSLLNRLEQNSKLLLYHNDSYLLVSEAFVNPLLGAMAGGGYSLPVMKRAMIIADAIGTDLGLYDLGALDHYLLGKLLRKMVHGAGRRRDKEKEEKEEDGEKGEKETEEEKPTKTNEDESEKEPPPPPPSGSSFLSSSIISITQHLMDTNNGLCVPTVGECYEAVYNLSYSNSYPYYSFHNTNKTQNDVWQMALNHGVSLLKAMPSVRSISSLSATSPLLVAARAAKPRQTTNQGDVGDDGDFGSANESVIERLITEILARGDVDIILGLLMNMNSSSNTRDMGGTGVSGKEKENTIRWISLFHLVCPFIRHTGRHIPLSLSSPSSSCSDDSDDSDNKDWLPILKCLLGSQNVSSPSVPLHAAIQFLGPYVSLLVGEKDIQSLLSSPINLAYPNQLSSISRGDLAVLVASLVFVGCGDAGRNGRESRVSGRSSRLPLLIWKLLSPLKQEERADVYKESHEILVRCSGYPGGVAQAFRFGLNLFTGMMQRVVVTNRGFTLREVARRIPYDCARALLSWLAMTPRKLWFLALDILCVGESDSKRKGKDGSSSCDDRPILPSSDKAGAWILMDAFLIAVAEAVRKPSGVGLSPLELREISLFMAQLCRHQHKLTQEDRKRARRDRKTEEGPARSLDLSLVYNAIGGTLDGRLYVSTLAGDLILCDSVLADEQGAVGTEFMYSNDTHPFDEFSRRLEVDSESTFESVLVDNGNLGSITPTGRVTEQPSPIRSVSPTPSLVHSSNSVSKYISEVMEDDEGRSDDLGGNGDYDEEGDISNGVNQSCFETFLFSHPEFLVDIVMSSAHDGSAQELVAVVEFVILRVVEKIKGRKKGRHEETERLLGFAVNVVKCYKTKISGRVGYVGVLRVLSPIFVLGQESVNENTMEHMGSTKWEELCYLCELHKVGSLDISDVIFSFLVHDTSSMTSYRPVANNEIKDLTVINKAASTISSHLTDENSVSHLALELSAQLIIPVMYSCSCVDASVLGSLIGKLYCVVVSSRPEEEISQPQHIQSTLDRMSHLLFLCCYFSFVGVSCGRKMSGLNFGRFLSKIFDALGGCDGVAGQRGHFLVVTILTKIVLLGVLEIYTKAQRVQTLYMVDPLRRYLCYAPLACREFAKAADALTSGVGLPKGFKKLEQGEDGKLLIDRIIPDVRTAASSKYKYELLLGDEERELLDKYNVSKWFPSDEVEVVANEVDKKRTPKNWDEEEDGNNYESDSGSGGYSDNESGIESGVEESKERTEESKTEMLNAQEDMGDRVAVEEQRDVGGVGVDAEAEANIPNSPRPMSNMSMMMFGGLDSLDMGELSPATGGESNGGTNSVGGES